MSSRVYELFLFDIYVAILKIEYVVEKFDDADSLKHDFISWDSVIREFEIIGEATNVLIKNSILSKENQIVVDLRNLLIHHYFGIDAEEIWDVVNDDLKVYKKLIKSKILMMNKKLKIELQKSIKDENKHIEFILNELNDLNEN